MEADRNPFPEFNILPRLKAAGEWIAQHLSVLPPQSEACLSEHVKHPQE